MSPVCTSCSVSVALLSNQFCLSCLQHFFTSLSLSLYSLRVASVFLPSVSDCSCFAFSTLLSSIIFHVLGEIHLSLLFPLLRPRTESAALFTVSLNLNQSSSTLSSCCRAWNLFLRSKSNSVLTFSSFRCATCTRVAVFHPVVCKWFLTWFLGLPRSCNGLTRHPLLRTLWHLAGRISSVWKHTCGLSGFRRFHPAISMCPCVFVCVETDCLLCLIHLQHSSMFLYRPVLTTATWFSPGHWRLLQTDCNECWTLQHVLSATPGSLIVAWHGSCIPSFIGWTFLNESTTNSVCSCTDASTTKLLGTWWTTARQYPTLPIVNGYVLPVVMKSLFHGTGSLPMDVGHLPSLARLSGTLCPRTCVIRMFLRTVTGSHWRRFFIFAVLVCSVH